MKGPTRIEPRRTNSQRTYHFDSRRKWLCGTNGTVVGLVACARCEPVLWCYRYPVLVLKHFGSHREVSNAPFANVSKSICLISSSKFHARSVAENYFPPCICKCFKIDLFHLNVLKIPCAVGRGKLWSVIHLQMFQNRFASFQRLENTIRGQ